MTYGRSLGRAFAHYAASTPRTMARAGGRSGCMADDAAASEAAEAEAEAVVEPAVEPSTVVAAEPAAAQAKTAEGGLILPHGWKYRWRDDRKAYVWLDPKHHVFDTYDKAQRAIERYLARMEDRPEEPAEKARVAAKVSNVATRAPVSKAAKLKSENKYLKE